MNDSIAAFHVHLLGSNRQAHQSSFEEARQRLEMLPKLYFEPDGSFVWAKQAGTEQVFGMLYDASGQVQYCDMRGKCQRATFRTLCEAISGTAKLQTLAIMQLPASQWQDFQSFERLIWS